MLIELLYILTRNRLTQVDIDNNLMYQIDID